MIDAAIVRRCLHEPQGHPERRDQSSQWRARLMDDQDETHHSYCL
jgi:hypothetical protein